MSKRAAATVVEEPAVVEETPEARIAKNVSSATVEFLRDVKNAANAAAVGGDRTTLTGLIVKLLA